MNEWRYDRERTLPCTLAAAWAGAACDLAEAASSLLNAGLPGSSAFEAMEQALERFEAAVERERAGLTPKEG